MGDAPGAGLRAAGDRTGPAAHTQGRRWGWGPGIGIGNAYVEYFPVGTLIVDLVDVRAQELVWRGRASDVLERGAAPADKDAAVARAVTKMFETFPPPGQAR